MALRALVVSVLVLAACSQSRFGREIGENIDPPGDVLKLAARDLTGAEQAVLDKRGLVILGKDPVQSFHVGYTALFHAHAPVYVTADSLLYAWHSSYDKILIEIEAQALIPALDAMLDGLRERLAKSEASPQARADLDVYLAVAASLSHGSVQAPVAGGDPSLVAALFDHGQRAEGLSFELFGTPAQFDFSMLKPRGHYADDPRLQQYFRTMSWLGRAEMQIGTRRDPREPWKINRRALDSAALLGSMFDASLRAKWETFDTTLAALVGPSDSMSLPGLERALAALGTVATKTDAEIGAAFDAPSAQKIRTQLVHVGESSIAFLLLGQRYVFDASVLGDLVAGSIDTIPPRMMPTPLDVAFAVFHNPAAGELLKPERARFGAPYAEALDRKASEPLPDGSVAHMWLGALRELSPDAKRDAALPAPLTSEPFARRILETQLASWAELRHDNLLYTKQSYTAELGCEFPTAYVDPYPAFYTKLGAMASRVRTTVAHLPQQSFRSAQSIDHYLDGMTKTMARLAAIAERERANQPITDDDLQWIDHMVSLDGRSIVCATTIDPKGWYADLFFEQKSALWHDPIVADVHTQPTDEVGNMVGRVLHVGTGLPRLMAITIRHDGGTHTQTYRGLVSSYGELVTSDFERLTDQEWRDRIGKGPMGTPPWLDEIVVR
ncbi:MAG: DUF3160 domain-containing protein [Polyangiales bacterium]